MGMTMASKTTSGSKWKPKDNRSIITLNAEEVDMMGQDSPKGIRFLDNNILDMEKIISVSGLYTNHQNLKAFASKSGEKISSGSGSDDGRGSGRFVRGAQVRGVRNVTDGWTDGRGRGVKYVNGMGVKTSGENWDIQIDNRRVHKTG